MLVSSSPSPSSSSSSPPSSSSPVYLPSALFFVFRDYQLCSNFISFLLSLPVLSLSSLWVSLLWLLWSYLSWNVFFGHISSILGRLLRWGQPAWGSLRLMVHSHSNTFSSTSWGFLAKNCVTYPILLYLSHISYFSFRLAWVLSPF